MKAKNTNIQSAIDYICSHFGFIALDEKDFELTCPNPAIFIDKKGETLNEVLEAVTAEWKKRPLPKPSSTVLFIESIILTMADIGYMKNSFNCTSLKEIDIPNGIRRLYSASFAGCTSLEYVSLPQRQFGNQWR